ncbi:MAG: GIY-YIG nuclease family protein [candidate division Zixibacteria bacterium]|nr:GIY-YIG nuclease family protein [candidate division Zixibacteria bacterium]
MGKRKSSEFSKEGIESLSNNKPVVYKILDQKDKNLYIGVAKRGRVEDRLKDHLPSGKDPIHGGKKVVIIQKTSIADAVKSETIIIKKTRPPQNKKGK